MKRSESVKASKRKDGVDLISDMPDPILLLILSHLPFIEEIIRTSILSKRWRYLWTSMSTVNIYCFHGSRHPGNFKKNKFKEFVYWVLINKSVDLDIFRLCCSDYYSMATIGRWIHTAITKNVKELDLIFRPKEEAMDVEMPHCLLTCRSLEVLRLNLGGRGLRLPNCKSFPSLRVLELTCVNLLEDHDSVKDFLESCPMLEELSLSDCLIWKLDLLYISCFKLQKLSIINLGDVQLCRCIKIFCPKLVFLDLTVHIASNFIFECLDSLEEAEIETEWMGSNSTCVLFPGISNVESLLINLYFLCQCIDAACDPTLPNLKSLVLKTTMDAFTIDALNKILKYYPKLESLELVIKEDFYGPEEWEFHEGDARRMLTSDVKRVEFFEFKGEKPKLVTEWEEITLLKMVFSWGNKAKNI